LLEPPTLQFIEVTLTICIEKSQQHHQNNMEMGDEATFGDDDQHFENAM